VSSPRKYSSAGVQVTLRVLVYHLFTFAVRLARAKLVSVHLCVQWDTACF